jgi:alcohol dehydrogenase class IV
MRFNSARKPGLYRRLSAALELSEQSDDAFIANIAALLEQIGLTGGLRPHGVNEDVLSMLSEAAFADSCHVTNPVPVTREDLEQLYASAL